MEPLAPPPAPPGPRVAPTPPHGLRPLLQRFTAEQSLLSALTAVSTDGHHLGAVTDAAGGAKGRDGHAGAAASAPSAAPALALVAETHREAPEVAEVRALAALQGATNRASGMRTLPNGAPLAVVRAMHTSRAERHEAALAAYRRDASAVADDAAEATRGAAAVFSERLAEADGEIEAELAATASDERLIVLEAEGVMRIWDEVAAQFPRRSEWVHELATELAEVEAERRTSLEAALAELLRALMETAHVSAGEAGRVVEVGAQEANLTMLANRREHAELVRRLLVREVHLEKSCRERWEAGAMRWRQLRTDQEIARFKQMMESDAVVDPPALAGLFAELSHKQRRAHDAMVAHVRRAEALLPPQCTAEGVRRWADEASRLACEWREAREGAMVHLTEAEAIVDMECAEAYQVLTEDVAHFAGDGGLSPDEARELLESECLTMVTARRERSEELLDDVRRYLDHCAHGDGALMTALGGFLNDIADLVANQAATARDRRREADGAMRECRERADATDDEQETAFARACAELRQGPSEAVLDAKVEEALTILDRIQDGYRAFHKESMGIIHAYPLDAQDDENAHQMALCDALGLRPNCPPPRKQETTEDEANEMAEEGAEGADGAEEANAAESAEDASGAAESEAATMPVESLPPAVTSRGTDFATLRGLYETVFAQLLPPPVDAEDEPAAEGAEEGAEEGGTEGEGAGAGAESAEAQPEAGEGEAAEDGAGDSGAAETPSYAAITSSAAPSLPHRARSGEACVQEIAIPESPLRALLEAMRGAALEHMEAQAALAHTRAARWEKAKEEAITNELDQRLRDHRPRAGIVEEDVRAGRFSELVAQQRTFERYVRRARRDVRRREDGYAVAMESAKEQLAAAMRRLEGLEPSLTGVASSASLDIKRRECAAQKEAVAALAKRVAADLSAKVAAKQRALEDANAKFAEDHLKPTDIEKLMEETKGQKPGTAGAGGTRGPGAGADKGGSGSSNGCASGRRSGGGVNPAAADPALACGAWSPDTVAACEARLAALLAENAAIAETQAEEAAALEVATVSRADELASSLESAVDPHREDLLLIESLDHILTTTRSKVRHAFEASEAATGRIKEASAQLLRLCEGCGAHTDILRALRHLATLLPPRARELACLASTNFEVAHVELEGDGEPKEEGGAHESAEKEEAPATVTAAVESVCEEAREALAAKASEYYKARASGEARAPTRPARIPESVEAMGATHDAQLASLRESCTAHVAAAASELRTQVIAISKSAVRIPSAVLLHLVSSELDIASERVEPLREAFEATHAKHEAMQNAHRDALRPGLSNPAREAELAELCAREVERAHMCVDAVVAHANDSVREVARAAARFRERLTKVVRVLAALFDNMLMPEDMLSLGGGKGGEESGKGASNSLKRKNLRQLWREREAKRREGEVELVQHETRPFQRRTWQPLDPSVLTLEAAGWVDLKALAPKVGGSTGGEAAIEGDKTEAEDAAEAEDEGAADGETDKQLEGLDIAPNHSLMTARTKALQQYKAYMYDSVQRHKGEAVERLSSETRWQTSWQGMVESVSMR